MNAFVVGFDAFDGEDLLDFVVFERVGVFDRNGVEVLFVAAGFVLVDDFGLVGCVLYWVCAVLSVLGVDDM